MSEVTRQVQDQIEALLQAEDDAITAAVIAGLWHGHGVRVTREPGGMLTEVRVDSDVPLGEIHEHRTGAREVAGRFV